MIKVCFAAIFTFVTAAFKRPMTKPPKFADCSTDDYIQPLSLYLPYLLLNLSSIKSRIEDKPKIRSCLVCFKFLRSRIAQIDLAFVIMY